MRAASHPIFDGPDGEELMLRGERWAFRCVCGSEVESAEARCAACGVVAEIEWPGKDPREPGGAIYPERKEVVGRGS